MSEISTLYSEWINPFDSVGQSISLPIEKLNIMGKESEGFLAKLKHYLKIRQKEDKVVLYYEILRYM